MLLSVLFSFSNICKWLIKKGINSNLNSRSQNFRGREAPKLVINPSTSEEGTTTESGGTGYTSSEEGQHGDSGEESPQGQAPLVVAQVQPQPKLSLPKMATPWIDEKLEKLMDEAFPLTDEEKAKAGSLMCPSLIFINMMKVRRGQEPIGWREPKDEKDDELPALAPVLSAEDKCPHLQALKEKEKEKEKLKETEKEQENEKKSKENEEMELPLELAKLSLEDRTKTINGCPHFAKYRK